MFELEITFTTGDLKGMTIKTDSLVYRPVGFEVSANGWTGPGYRVVSCVPKG